MSRLAVDAKARIEVVRRQLAAAQVVILNKTDLVNAADLKKIETAMRLIAHNTTDELDAMVYQATNGDVAPSLLTNTSLFSFEKAKALPYWPRQRTNSISSFIMGELTDFAEWVPEPFGQSFVYRSPRAFQPERLHKVTTSSVSLLKV